MSAYLSSLIILSCLTCMYARVTSEPAKFENPWKDADWNKLAKETITKNKIVSESPLNTKKAKNVILFMGDGMGVSTVSAARIYKAQSRNLKETDTYLEWEKFPDLALTRTYIADRVTADSASSATAFLSGSRANYGAVGVDKEVKFEKCDKFNDHILKSIAHYSMERDKWTGFVTNTRVTHASPAGVFASSPSRIWEDMIPNDCKKVVPDIAKQLVLDERNKNIQVILGGGAAKFLPQNESYDVYKQGGSRLDKVNLIESWIKMKRQNNYSKSKPHSCLSESCKDSKYKFISTRDQLMKLNTQEVDYLLGLFSKSHMAYEYERLQQTSPEPSLAEMTEVAIKILSKGENGFFLFVEGGKIDQSHHLNQAKIALNETLAMEAAVMRALSLTNDSETLILVTADHSHMFTYGHYGSFEESIFGTTKHAYPEDKKPILQMFYGSGPSYLYHRNTSDHLRRNLEGVDTERMDFQQDAGTYTKYESHGGEDVAVYAKGPWSHLFRGTEEQTYVAHVMMYASCVGEYVGEEHCK